MKYEKIGIVFAMEGEAEPTIKHFGLKLLKTKASVGIYSNTDNSVFVSLNGKSSYGVDNIGTNAAVLNTYVMCDEINPDIVINAGTAGGFESAGGKIGDVYVGRDKLVFHDRRIPIPLYYEYGIGSYKLMKTDLIAQKLNIKQGIISTGNSLDHVKEDIELIHKNEAVLKDMEAASVAWICEILGKPFLPLKAVTDLVDSESETEVEFQRNFNYAVERLNSKLIELIKFLTGEGI